MDVCMDKDLSNGLMVENIMVNISMIKNMEKVYFNGVH